MFAPPPNIEFMSSPKSQTFTMISVSTPDAKQSEAYIATTALFSLFSSSAREDKVFLRLPASWRDFWTELAETKREKSDEADRNSIRIFRDMVREKRDQEMEEGVLIQGAFKNRIVSRATEISDEIGPDKTTRFSFSPEAYQKIWTDKSSTQSYQMMLVSISSHQVCIVIDHFLAIAYATANVEFQRESPRCYRSRASDYHLWRDRLVSKMRFLVPELYLLVY